MCDGRLLHIRAPATGEFNRRRCRTLAGCVERLETWMRAGHEAERIGLVVVWLQCLLVDIVRHTVSWRQTVLTFVCQNSDLLGDQLRIFQTVKPKPVSRGR